MATKYINSITYGENEYKLVDDSSGYLKNYYGVCSTTAGTVWKTVSIDGFDSNSLVAGVRVSVKFTYNNTVGGPSLNVSDTGAKYIWGKTITNSGGSGNPSFPMIRWSAGEVVDFVYDGTYWCVISADQEPYYFYCMTAASAQAKIVSDNPLRFMLYQGARVTIRFMYAQTYNGTPTLNVDSTGAKSIYVDGATPAGQYEWTAGEVLDFVYNGTYWIIVGRNRATTQYYGVTKLSNTIADDETMALTPKAVYDAGYTTNAGTITEITTSSPLSGSGTSGSVALSHSTSGVVADTYGSSSQVPVFTVDATGHITEVTNTQISTSQKVEATLTNPESSVNYYLTFSSVSSGAAYIRVNNGIRYYTKEGTTSDDGFGGLRLGNTTDSGIEGNKWGFIDLYPQTGAYFGRIRAAATLTGNRVYTFPNKTGTVALTSDISALTFTVNSSSKNLTIS